MKKLLDKLTVILVDQPGRERDALKTILTSMKNVEKIEVLDQYRSLQNWLTSQYPDVVVIRERLIDCYWLEQIQTIKAANPNLRFLFVAETTEHIKELLEAGADHVFLKGFSSIELFNLLDQWSMEKIMNYFGEKHDLPNMFKQSSNLQLLV